MGRHGDIGTALWVVGWGILFSHADWALLMAIIEWIGRH
jgi:hypothetical protein